MGRAPDHAGFTVALVEVQTGRDKGLQSSVVQSMDCETAFALERGEPAARSSALRPRGTRPCTADA
jgi:hypothetical protein